MINPGFTIDNSSMNAVKAKVELYDGPTLVKTCTCSDVLQNFSVDRIGENNKFFGFGICQALKLTLIDMSRELHLSKGNIVKVAYGDGTNFVYPYPTFYIEEVTRDEETNSLDIVAYDLLYKATEHTVSEITNLEVPYTTFRFFVNSYQVIGGTAARLINSPQNLTHEELPNFGGTETIRQAMDAAAEISQVVYYLDENDNLELKKLDIAGDPVLTITKNDYFSLKTGDNVVLDAICAATELGNNVIHPSEVTNGNIQYIRDNPFLELREDMDTVLAGSWNKVNGLAINEFTCEEWTGNYLLEIGDKIALETEDGGSVISYVLNDSISFDGTVSETTQWTYEPSNAETASNPTSLGEKINQTFARVDKANKQIELVASESNANKQAISALQINTESISASVTSLSKETDDKIDNLNDSMNNLSSSVTAQISSTQASINVVNETLSNGVEKVQTSTGFVFDKDGLTISKTGKDITTQITEDGMTISRGGEEVLTADNQGVKAEDLHATTWLIIGNNSRIEDWTDENGNSRTACFWIGG